MRRRTGRTVTDDFEGLPGGNVAGSIAQTGANYSEHFAGQTVTTGGFDVLSGTPSAPLTLQPSALLADNVGILNIATNVIYGDLANLIGEGAVSVLFTQDATQLGFNVVGVDGGGTLTVQFFDRTGASLGTIAQALPTNGFFGFRATAGEHIAGISITNTDPAGVGYDNVTFDM